jgi:hypothetical protein
MSLTRAGPGAGTLQCESGAHGGTSRRGGLPVAASWNSRQVAAGTRIGVWFTFPSIRVDGPLVDFVGRLVVHQPVLGRQESLHEGVITGIPLRQ